MMVDLSTKAMNFKQPPEKTRVVVAMSGGVDSSVVAALFKEAGYDVVGVTLQLYDQGSQAKRKGACCAGQDIYDAKNVAEKLGFPHYVLDYESIFKQSVIDDFADSYLRGETPVPCIRCNQRVKFKDLLRTAKDLGGHALATGHYVQRAVGQDGGANLLSGVDPKKDQSYFMFSTTQEQLEFLRFPLGGVEKATTREMAKKFNLPVHEKPDSQDICFVPNGSYADLVKKMRPESLQPGKIVTEEGLEVGEHSGIIGFTVGQRKGLNINAQTSSSSPWYVIALDAREKKVIVGPKESLSTRTFSLQELNWIGGSTGEDLQLGEIKCDIKIRSTTPPVPGKAYLNFRNKTGTIELDVPEYGVSAGQACVLYKGVQVLGGGWISK